MMDVPELGDWEDGCASGYCRATAALNVRATPGGTVIGGWREGELVIAWFRVGEWVFVTGLTAEDGRAGYSHGAYLAAVGADQVRGVGADEVLRGRALRAASCLQAMLAGVHGRSRFGRCGRSGAPSPGQSGRGELAG